ncbi:MAG: helix-turn-helix domain-containing protein [Spirochaetaceae bacterium]|jgi:hypothetical protein|nr:helix-turn-helix domain-containing protein [Spirochaetaceae bacterium]
MPVEQLASIEKIRTHFGTNHAGLEKILGLSNGYLGNIEKKGTDNPGKLLTALNEKGISADWFITGEGEMLLNPPPRTQSGQEAATLELGFKVPYCARRYPAAPAQTDKMILTLLTTLRFLICYPAIRQSGSLSSAWMALQ